MKLQSGRNYHKYSINFFPHYNLSRCSEPLVNEEKQCLNFNHFLAWFSVTYVNHKQIKNIVQLKNSTKVK